MIDHKDTIKAAALAADSFGMCATALEVEDIERARLYFSAGADFANALNFVMQAKRESRMVELNVDSLSKRVAELAKKMPVDPDYVKEVLEKMGEETELEALRAEITDHLEGKKIYRERIRELKAHLNNFINCPGCSGHLGDRQSHTCNLLEAKEAVKQCQSL